ESAGRNGADALGKCLDAGVRVAVIVGADRANDDPDRALAAGNGRTLPARSAEHAIAGTVLRARHGVGYENDLAANGRVRRALEVGDTVEADDFARDARRAGRSAIAERRDDQLLGKG